MKAEIKFLKSGLLSLALITLTLMSISCSKDEGPSNPDPAVNQAPADFDLIGVTNGATKVDVLPSFSWKPSMDPDGDAVTYDLLLDTQADPTTVYASNLTTTSFKGTERLHLTTPYSWKVVAKDNKGKSMASNTNNFNTRGLNFPSAPVTAAAFPKGLSGHTSAVFQDYLWVIGGISEGGGLTNKVWYSANGADWLEASILLTPFTARFDHTTAVFNNKLWIIGGYDGSLKNDVWYSEDGTTWVMATAAAKFSPRFRHTTAVFDNKLWVIGGMDGTWKNDVWYSSDGITWEAATNVAAFAPRAVHSTAVFDNKLWVIAGVVNSFKVNDVWFSNDGATWALATEKADFLPTASHTTAVFDDKLWVIGGSDGSRNNGVWYSIDGVTWAPATGTVPFSGRDNHTTVVFENMLWVIGGRAEGGTHWNDVWAMD